MPSCRWSSPGASFLLGLGLLALAGVSDDAPEPTDQATPSLPPATGRRDQHGVPEIGSRISGRGETLTLYRVVKHGKPREDDFYSGRQAGELQADKEIRFPELYDAVSLWTTASRARDLAIEQPRRGRFIA